MTFLSPLSLKRRESPQFRMEHNVAVFVFVSMRCFQLITDFLLCVVLDMFLTIDWRVVLLTFTWFYQ